MSARHVFTNAGVGYGVTWIWTEQTGMLFRVENGWAEKDPTKSPFQPTLADVTFKAPPRTKYRVALRRPLYSRYGGYRVKHRELGHRNTW